MTTSDPSDRTIRSLLSTRAMLLLNLPTALITAVHWGMGPKMAWIHDVLRRLYYTASPSRPLPPVFSL